MTNTEDEFTAAVDAAMVSAQKTLGALIALRAMAPSGAENAAVAAVAMRVAEEAAVFVERLHGVAQTATYDVERAIANKLASVEVVGHG